MLYLRPVCLHDSPIRCCQGPLSRGTSCWTWSSIPLRSKRESLTGLLLRSLNHRSSGVWRIWGCESHRHLAEGNLVCNAPTGCVQGRGAASRHGEYELLSSWQLTKCC